MNSENSERVLDSVVVPASSSSRVSLVQKVVFWMALLFGLKLIAPFVPIPSRFAAVAIGAFFIVAYSVSIVGFAARLMQFRFSLFARVATLLGLVVAWYVLGQLLAPQFASLVRRPNLDTSQLLMLGLGRATIDLLLLSAAIMGGGLVAQMLSAPNILGPLCAFCFMIDVWFVLFGGIAAQIAERAPGYVAKVTAPAPAVGAATSSQYFLPPIVIGAADYLLLGLVFAAMHRFSMNWRASTKWMWVLVSGALLAVGLGIGMLPGFVFIALATLIPNWKFFQFSRDERFALLYAGGFIVLLTIGLHFATPYIVERMRTVK